MDVAFKSSLRLKTKEQFQNVFQKARKIPGKSFSLFFKPNRLEFSRIGIIISKKAVAKACRRNRLKRIVRESFRLHQNEIKGKDIVFLAYKGLEEISNEELRTCLEQKWPRARL